MTVQRQHILVIGAPRSGTTLLATMIGRHTDVGMMNEDVTGVWMKKVVGKPWTGNKLCVPNQIQLEPKGWLSRRIFKTLGVVREAPRSTLCIADYLAMPNVKIVAIIRDGNDCVGSMMTRAGNRFIKAARRWAAAIDTIYAIADRHRERILVAPFEHVVLHPEPQMRAVCAFLGLPFQERMLEGHKFNPFYPRDKLDTAIAFRHQRQATDLHLERVFPGPVEKYRRLMATCGSVAEVDSTARRAGDGGSEAVSRQR